MSAGRDVSVHQDFSTRISAAVAEVEFPVFSVPLADKRDRFWAREELLGDLAARVAGPVSAVALTQTLAGMGGVGKSQLAAQVTYRKP